LKLKLEILSPLRGLIVFIIACSHGSRRGLHSAADSVGFDLFYDGFDQCPRGVLNRLSPSTPFC
jgi:hypothetical protein